MKIKKIIIIITFLMTFIVNAFSINDSLIVSKTEHSISTSLNCDHMKKENLIENEKAKKDCQHKKMNKTDCKSKKCEDGCCKKSSTSTNIVCTEHVKTLLQSNQKEKTNEEIRNEKIERISSLYRPPIK